LTLEYDWSVATTEQKKKLFPVCNRLRKRYGILWPAFFDKAGLHGVAPYYEQNLRRGKVSSLNAAALFTWIISTHPTEAVRLIGHLRRPAGGKSYTPSSYQELLFRRVNYSMYGPHWRDEAPQPDEDPDAPPRRKKKKD